MMIMMITIRRGRQIRGGRREQEKEVQEEKENEEKVVEVEVEEEAEEREKQGLIARLAFRALESERVIALIAQRAYLGRSASAGERLRIRPGPLSGPARPRGYKE